jgi:hypothetical protein
MPAVQVNSGTSIADDTVESIVPLFDLRSPHEPRERKSDGKVNRGNCAQRPNKECHCNSRKKRDPSDRGLKISSIKVAVPAEQRES